MIYDEGGDTGGLGIKLDDGILSAKIKTGVDELESTHPVNLADDEWHHVAVTYGDSPRTFKLYVDGEASGDQQLLPIATVPAHADPPALGAIIGTAVYAGPGYFKGLLDDYRIYDRVLSNAEVKALHDLGQ